MTSSFSEEVTSISGPAFHFDLAAFDACHPIHYSRRLLIFRCGSPAQFDAQLAALKIGLSALVLHCPILSGLVTTPPAELAAARPDWRTIVPGQGLELIVKDLRDQLQTFEELEAAEFPLDQLPYRLLVPIPEDIDNDRRFAACKVQLSAIRGGTILTFSMSHSVGDGTATNELLRILSEETRRAQEQLGGNAVSGAALSAPPVVLGLDRSAIRDIKSDTPFNIQDHPAFVLTASKAPEDHPFRARTPQVPVLLQISPANLAKLKSDATLPDAPPISTHDALAALIWRSVLIIRSRRSTSAPNIEPPTEGRIFLPSDARRHLNLTQSYIGNVVYQLTAELDLATLFSSSGLQHAASALRRAIKAVTPEIVSSYMAETNARWVDWKFVEFWPTTGVAMGTDWTSGVLYDYDWGEVFGPLIRYRFPGEAFTCILPKLPNGTAELIVAVEPAEADTLKGDECFGRYL